MAAGLLWFAALVAFAGPADAGGPDSTNGAAPADGWQLAAVRGRLPQVENIVMGPDGTIYASLEREGARGGDVVRIRKGVLETLVAGLPAAHGLELYGNYLYVTEAIPEGRVLRVDVRNRTVRELARLHNPNGIVMLPDGDLAVSEASVNGRIVRIRSSGATEVITSGLNHPEGLAVSADGTLYFCEAVTGRVLAWHDGEMTVLVEDLEVPDQVELGPDGTLWITEDARPGRVLRYKDGAVEVIASGLNMPQGMAVTGDTTVLVAEQGRGRILSLTRAEH